MPFDPEGMLLEIDRKVTVNADRLEKLIHRLEGNGRPGIIDEFYAVKQGHEECQRQRAAAAKLAEYNADRSLRVAIALSSIISSVITMVLGKVLTHV